MHDYERSSRDYARGGTLPVWALASAHLRQERAETRLERAVWAGILTVVFFAMAAGGCWLRGW